MTLAGGWGAPLTRNEAPQKHVAGNRPKKTSLCHPKTKAVPTCWLHQLDHLLLEIFFVVPKNLTSCLSLLKFQNAWLPFGFPFKPPTIARFPAGFPSKMPLQKEKKDTPPPQKKGGYNTKTQRDKTQTKNRRNATSVQIRRQVLGVEAVGPWPGGSEASPPGIPQSKCCACRPFLPLTWHLRETPCQVPC